MTYSEAIEFLNGLRLFGAKLGLDNTHKLAELAGNPQNQLRFIHVAGTNGKGSTCALLESIYRAAGLRTGLFTSPHLVRFAERLQVNRTLMAEADVARLTAQLRRCLREFAPGPPPTFFEVVTVMALKYFAEQNCEIVLWETGMGGRLDATNIVTPLAGVITNIGFDHQEWLGDTVEQIAAEKAGIIKPGVPVITAAELPQALNVIERTARKNQAPLRVVTAAEAESGWMAKAPLPLPGRHQRLNAATAAATVEELSGQIPVSRETILAGLQNVRWPGRMQLLKTAAGMLLIDGAHNVSSAEQLRRTLEQQFPETAPVLILGILHDKDWRGICRVLTPCASRVLAVPVASERSTDADEIRAACAAAHPEIMTQSFPNLARALEATATEPFVLVTGSLYLAGEAMELLGISPANRRDERALNEWSQTPPSLP